MGLTLDAVLNALVGNFFIFLEHYGEKELLKGHVHTARQCAIFASLVAQGEEFRYPWLSSQA